MKGVVIAAHFEEGPLKELIHSFKYESLKGLDQTLANFLAAALKRYNFKTDYLISYVPLHRSRYHWRGYNQSELLAKKTAEAMNMYFLKNLLRKKKKTKYQIQLKRSRRKS
ncbi:hypothetical protein M1307_02390, partial [Patescibacteria group bacterium]|nr:hypothetical protein [Patescibacteria group bacterium]